METSCGLAAAIARRRIPLFTVVLSTTLGVSGLGLASAAWAQSVNGNKEQGDAQGSLSLGTVEVESTVPNIYAPVDGYNVKRERSATKTDTPLSKTAQTVSVITNDQIQDRQADSLANVLEYGSAGVSGSPFGFEPRYTFLRIRGFDVSDNALYRDGLKLIAPPVVGGSGTAVTYNYEPYGAERIVVPKGPASTLYGQAAPGGLVNYVSKRPTFEKRGEVGVEYGSHDHVQGEFDVSGPVGDSDKVAYRLVGLARDADTAIDYVQNDRVYIAPSMTWAPTDATELTLLASYQKDETKSSQAYPARGTLVDSDNGEIPRSRFTGEPGLDRYDRTTYMLGYEFEHAFDDHLTFRQNARYTDIQVDDISVYASDFDGDRTVSRSNYNNLGELDSLVVDNQFQIDFDSGERLEHVVIAGIDYQHANLKSFQSFQAASPLDIYDPQYGTEPDIEAAGAFADQTGTQNQIGFYLQDEVTFDERWVATLGGRYDRASRSTNDNLTGTTTTQDDNEFTWRGSLLYAADNGLSPYFAYSEGFLPSLGSDANGNAYEPETSTQYEVGVKYMPENASYGVTVALFDLTRENYLTTNPNFVTEQVGEAQSQGVEVEAVASLTEGLDVTASYAYVDAEITQSASGNEGNRPQLSPEHQASVWADYTIQKGALADLGFGAGVRYKDSIFGDNANSSEVPDVTLFDAAVHYDWNSYEFAVNARNLFDKKYVGASYARGTDDPPFFATYGESRSIIGSVKYRW
tara:strand:+ start:1669 stop:3909 length:2241 start_codon:yes stop_codon:yes gene_type:complete